jgi:sulfur transfer complex TusBCD TusB component (DsrH family)
VAFFATVDDVVARYDGEIPMDKLAYVDQQLSDAEVEVTAIAGDLMARIVAGKTTAAGIKVVLCRMVIRLLRNSDGVATQSVGPFSYTLDKQVASGRLFVSPADRRLLGLRGGSSSVALSDGALEHVAAHPYPWGSRLDRWPESSC